MNVPSIWMQLIIAYVGFTLLPYIIALLIKLRVFPLVALWLVVDSFEEWALANGALCRWLFIAFIAYPVVVAIFKFVRWRIEERQLTNQILATAHYWNDPNSIIDR